MSETAGRSEAYPAPMIAIHWFTALCVFGLIPVGLIMANMDDGPMQDRLFSLHESFGVLVFALTIVRLVWKATGRLPKPAAVLTPFERIASRSAHGILYVLLLFTPIVGWLGVSAFGAEAGVFGLFTLPGLLAKDEDLADRIFNVHLGAAILIAIVALAHVIGAVVHAVRRDGVMLRMAPGRRSSGRSNAPGE
jgi:cytochrome b561